MPRITKTNAVANLISAVVFLFPIAIAQDRIAGPEYDYYSLALSSISECAHSATKLRDIPQRVKIRLYAAKSLPPSRRDEALHLLDVSLDDLKQWGSDDKATPYRRNSIASLRNDLLAEYASLDRERALVLQKEFESKAESSDRNRTTPPKTDWQTEFNDRRTIADQTAKLSSNLLKR
jgi:hypothetical protein